MSFRCTNSISIYCKMITPSHHTSPYIVMMFFLWWELLRGAILFFFKNFIYLFLERKRGRETLMCGCLSGTPYWGPVPQPRHVPRLGIELATLWFAGWHSIHWATPARARGVILISVNSATIQKILLKFTKSNIIKFSWQSLSLKLTFQTILFQTLHLFY